MAVFLPVEGPPSLPDFDDIWLPAKTNSATSTPSPQNTVHQSPENKVLENLKHFMSGIFGSEVPQCQSEDQPYLEDGSYDTPSLDALLPASSNQQFVQDMAFTDLFLSQCENVRREDANVSPINYRDVPPVEGMLTGSKRSYDAIDNEDGIDYDEDAEGDIENEDEDDAVIEDCLLPTASVSQVPSNANAFNNADSSHYAAGQQTQFHYARANRVLPLAHSPSVDNGDNSTIGHNPNDTVYPVRPHTEPLSPPNYDTTPHAGGGTPPLIPKFPCIKLPKLLRLDLTGGQVSAQSDGKHENPVGLVMGRSQYRPIGRYSTHRRTQTMPITGNVYPYPPNTFPPELPDNDNPPYISHQFKSTAGQQIYSDPVDSEACAPYKFHPLNSGAPQMNSSHIRSGLGMIHLPNGQPQAHRQVLAFTFTIRVPKVGGQHLENGIEANKSIYQAPASMLQALPIDGRPLRHDIQNSEPVCSPPAPALSTFTTTGRGRSRDTDEHPDYIVRIKDGMYRCKVPGCSTLFAAEDTTKGRVQNHLNATHYRGLDINEKGQCLWPGCAQPDATKRSSHGRHISEIHFAVIKYECRVCGLLCTRTEKVLEHVRGSCHSVNKRQKID